ncbi:MAG TPA: DUF488 domain-containing protein [Chthonomonadaceae bacterium]|nr:DUF488 domain-containing protein [Chthonomonadaceae bacterium]
MSATNEWQILYTIGHSNHEAERFLALLRLHGIEAICDVRSQPYSQYCPQFNRDALEPALRAAGVRYAFLGRELGARTDDPACYRDGRVEYARLAETEQFRSGVRRVLRAMQTHRVALMCAEKDPLTCHRSILICRTMRADTDEIVHILEDGGTETQQEAERRLMDTLKIVYPDLFHTEAELIEQAYDRQGERIAYVQPAAP